MIKTARLLTTLMAAAALYGLYRVAVSMWHTFLDLQKEVAAALIAAAATVLVSVFSVLISKQVERRREIEAEIRLKKVPMYVSLVEFWMTSIQQNEAVALAPEERAKEAKKFFVSFTQDLMIWGSDDVIAKWSRFRRKLAKVSDQSDPRLMSELFLEFEELLIAIRRDTGHRADNIKKGELLGLFVNDIDDFISSGSGAPKPRSIAVKGLRDLAD